MAVFKAYDIRGTVPDQLNADLAYGVGRATARFIGADRLVVGRDARSHSPELCAALIRGIGDEGVSVDDVGLVATPMVYYAVSALGAGGGIMAAAHEGAGLENSLGFNITLPAPNFPMTGWGMVPSIRGISTTFFFASSTPLEIASAT